MPRHSNAKRQSPRKPEMERKRRRRINDCLSQIKQLIPEAKELEIKKGCRLEKAEILEITVEFIRKMNNKLSADKMMQADVPESPTGTSNSVELGEERPPFLDVNTVPTGPTIFSGKFPGCCDLPLEYDPSPLYTRQIHETRVYPPIFRPTPRFFTPLCVSSNNFDHMRGEPLCAFPQSVECPLIKEASDARKLDENKTCI